MDDDAQDNESKNADRCFRFKEANHGISMIFIANITEANQLMALKRRNLFYLKLMAVSRIKDRN